MRISRLTVWHLTLPLIAPYRFSGGRQRVEALDTTYLRMETDEGLTGWGEGSPWGHAYLPAHGPGIRAGIETLASAVLGRDPRSLAALHEAMDRQLPGHQSAKSVIDIAAWDILGQAAGLPLWQLFGGDAPHPVALNSSISTGTPEEMIARIEAASAKGYRTHSAKLGGADIGGDIARMNAIAEAMPEGESITFDINRAWAPATAIRVLNSVTSRDWVEQPCETLAECAHVAGRVPQPMLLDECCHSFGDHLEAWRLGACEGVKIKPNRLGGLTRCLQVRDFCLSVGWRVHIEDVGGTALADTAAYHLASATPESHRMASWLAHAHLAEDPVPDQGVRNEGGFAAPPTTPGLGVIPDPDRLGTPVAVYKA
ncbi:MAG: mandelate racemase/muconate lactonizing enzyme family protein [Pseudomonadota bacterium]